MNRRLTMSQVSLLRDQVKQAHEFLEGTVADVVPEQAHWLPPGKANPLGATYAHVLMGEDGFVNGMLRQAAPLAVTSWAGKVGVSEPPPPPFPPKPWDQWGRQVRVDLSMLRQYAQAVYAVTDEYLASLADGDLTRQIDLSGVGLGTQTLGWVISNGVLGHVFSHWGEIACLKGLQGAQGFPV